MEKQWVGTEVHGCMASWFTRMYFGAQEANYKSNDKPIRERLRVVYNICIHRSFF